MTNPIPDEYHGWWRIVDTGTWVNDGLDILGPALLSLTGLGDRLRMHCLLAYVNARSTKTGVSFSWEGAWEYDQMSGTGSVRLGKDGRLKGKLRIKDGDDSTRRSRSTATTSAGCSTTGRTCCWSIPATRRRWPAR